MLSEIQNYNQNLPLEYSKIADFLAEEICKTLPMTTYKIWHAHPVWFINDNPIVGYSKQKCGLKLMFWSGQSFEELNLKASGKFKAAEICYNLREEIIVEELQQWLQKAEKIQWDYKNIVKRKGVLERLV